MKRHAKQNAGFQTMQARKTLFEYLFRPIYLTSYFSESMEFEATAEATSTTQATENGSGVHEDGTHLVAHGHDDYDRDKEMKQQRVIEKDKWLENYLGMNY